MDVLFIHQIKERFSYVSNTPIRLNRIKAFIYNIIIISINMTLCYYNTTIFIYYNINSKIDPFGILKSGPLHVQVKSNAEPTRCTNEGRG